MPPLHFIIFLHLHMALPPYQRNGGIFFKQQTLICRFTCLLSESTLFYNNFPEILLSFL